MNRLHVSFYQFAGAVVIVMAGVSHLVPLAFLRWGFMALLIFVIVRIILMAAVDGIKAGAGVFVNSMAGLTGTGPEELLDAILKESNCSMKDEEKEIVAGAMHAWGGICEGRVRLRIHKWMEEEAANEKAKSTYEQAADKETGDAGAYQGGDIYQTAGQRGPGRGRSSAGRS